jgi:hypothetical protein
MILKLCGCLFVLTSGTFGAFSLVKYQKTKLRVLDAWIDLIFFIRTQIDCYLMPIGDILSGGDRALFEACMSPSNAADLPAILNASGIYLDGDGKRLIENFVREIGSGYREEQLKRCDFFISSLRNEREKIAAALPMRVRLCATLCICIALATAILLW